VSKLKLILNVIYAALSFGKAKGWFKEKPGLPPFRPLAALTVPPGELRGRTAKRLGWALWGFLLLAGYLTWIELAAIRQGGDSTISRLVWYAWATQPGAILLVLVPLSWIVAYLFGHFFWQNRGLYDEIRKGGR